MTTFTRKREFLEWLRGIEKKWQETWRRERVFEPRIDPSRPKYFITVPYPYANGPLHIGHGRTYTIGDIIARYKRLRGFNVLYPMAFHITGTPIIAFSDMISRGDERTIAMYREYIKLYVEDEKEVDKILESFKDPLNLAVFFAERIQRDFMELGYSIDWRRKFHTGEPVYNKFIEWQYSKLLEKGLITRGDHVVTYCILHNQPEGEDDIQDADVNPVEIIEYTAIKFKIIDEDTYILAGTLRPETIFGVVNIWINPRGEYVLFKWSSEKYITSKTAYTKLRYQHPDEDLVTLKHISGSDLVGKWVESPLGDRVIVLPARFVDPDSATGIVYSEPSDAPYDYVALVELKFNKESLKTFNIDPVVVDTIEPKKIIHVPGVEGHHAKIATEQLNIISQDDPRLEEVTQRVYREQYYNGVMIVEDPEFRNLSVREAKEKIKNKLYAEGKAIPFYELNRRARCRAGGEILVAKIKDQWFINYNLGWLKERARRALVDNEIVITPDKYRKQFLDTVDWLDKRPCARKRGIGTRLPWSPEWIIESLSDSTIYMAFYTIAHIIRERGVSAESLVHDLFDYVFLGIGSPTEISAKTGIPRDVIEEMRREFTYWYPVDHRHTAIPHISNHLSFYILHHLAIFPDRYIPKLISLNETVIREGAKMSKSKGNVIPLRHITTMYSADLFRLYISWASSLDNILDWREVEVEKVINSLFKFINISKSVVESECREMAPGIYHEWFTSKFYELVSKATEAVESLEIRNYVQIAFFDVLTLIDKYRDLAGEDYVCGVREILLDWITILNPIIPHITEEINQWLGRRDLLSTSKWPEIRPVNEKILILMNAVEALIYDIKELLGLIKKKPGAVYVIIAPEWKREIARLILENISLRNIINTMRKEHSLTGREAEIAETYAVFSKMDKSTLEKIVKTESIDEKKVYESIVEYLKTKTSIEAPIVILWEDEARARGIPKAERALPLKPALYVD